MCVNTEHFVSSCQSFADSILFDEPKEPYIADWMSIEKTMLKSVFSPDACLPSERGKIFPDITKRRNSIRLSQNTGTPTTIRGRNNGCYPYIWVFLKCFYEVGDSGSSTNKYDMHSGHIVEKNHFFQVRAFKKKNTPIIIGMNRTFFAFFIATLSVVVAIMVTLFILKTDIPQFAHQDDLQDTLHTVFDTVSPATVAINGISTGIDEVTTRQ